MDAADVFVSRLMDEEEKEEPTVSTKTTPSSSAPSHPHGHAEVLWYYQDPQGNVQGNFVSKFGPDNTTLFCTQVQIGHLPSFAGELISYN